MRFALVNNIRTEATPEQKGLCQECGENVTAKCGKQRVWHWSHKTKRNCDNRWETEGEWHRNWKNQFSHEWQEIIRYDEKTGEKHIADVRTTHGLVIEFQHSSIDPQEQDKREGFHKDMVWIVDGTRLKKDYPRFLERRGWRSPWQQVETGLFLVSNPQQCFPVSWHQRNVPIFFDFLGFPIVDPSNMEREHLWCLLPGRPEEGKAIVVATARKDFITASTNGTLINWLYQITQKAKHFIENEKRHQAWLKRTQDPLNLILQASHRGRF